MKYRQSLGDYSAGKAHIAGDQQALVLNGIECEQIAFASVLVSCLQRPQRVPRGSRNSATRVTAEMSDLTTQSTTRVIKHFRAEFGARRTPVNFDKTKINCQ